MTTLKLLMLSLCAIAPLFSFAQTEIPANAPIENMHLVSPGIYRGARPADAKAMSFLKAMGIKTVINLQGGDTQSLWFGWAIPYIEKGETVEARRAEQNLAAENNLLYINSPLNSLDRVSPEQHQKITQILEIMKDPRYQPVYVHCAHGADRTGLVVALYRVKYQKWHPQAAYREMKEKGHNFFHFLFTSAMDQYFVKEVLGVEFF